MNPFVVLDAEIVRCGCFTITATVVEDAETDVVLITFPLMVATVVELAENVLTM